MSFGSKHNSLSTFMPLPFRSFWPSNLKPLFSTGLAILAVGPLVVSPWGCL